MKSYPDYQVYGTDMNGDSLNAIERNSKVALVLGNEGQEIKEETLSETYKNITINTDIESLNVGVAGSIIMHHINEME